MATYNNDLRLKEITTGDEDGTWGTSTNTNLSLIADAFSLGTKQMAANADETFTIPDGSVDAARSLYLKITSAVSLTTTRTVTLAPNTVSKVWIIENATTGGQSIAIAQGSGGTVTITNGSKVMIATDGAGAGAAVVNANPTAAAQVYPGAGIAVSTGSAWTTSKASPTGAIVGTTDTQTLTAKTLGNYTETVFAITDGTTVNLNPNNGPIQTWTLGANRTPGQANWAAGQSITLMVDDGTARTITWSTLAVVWKTDGGVAPTLNTTGFTVIALWKVGTTIYGARVGNA
jgi:hypothetical protein